MKLENFKKAEALSKRITSISNAVNRLQADNAIDVVVTISNKTIVKDELKFGCQGYVKDLVVQTLKNNFIAELNDLQKEFAAL